MQVCRSSCPVALLGPRCVSKIPISVAETLFQVSLILHSILYKTKLPFIIVFNKIDAQPHDFALNWMQDFETFQEALATHRSTTDDEGAPTYMNSLMNSMSLVLDEFYKHLKVCIRRNAAYTPVESYFRSQ